MPQGRRPLACYHEAGHCLARWYVGRHFDSATVLTVEEVRASATIPYRRGNPVPSVEGLMSGYELVSPAWTLATLNAESGTSYGAWLKTQALAGVEAELFELVAATWAEARYRKCSTGSVVLTGGNGDWTRFRDVLGAWFPDPATRSEVSRRAERRASALIRSPRGWAAIAAMAAELRATGYLEWEAGSAMCEAAYGWQWAFRSDLTLPDPAVIRAGSIRPPCAPPPRDLMTGATA